MAGDVGTEATLRIGPDGRISAANEAALELLGMSLDELRRLPGGALAAEPVDPEEQAMLRHQWEASGRAGLAGLTTIRRPVDGRELRISFAIAQLSDGSFIASLKAAPHTNGTKTTVYTVGDVLGRWRAAERHLEEVPVGSPEYEEIQQEVEALRGQYLRLFDTRARAS
jgi:PAS domain-containing protein